MRTLLTIALALTITNVSFAKSVAKSDIVLRQCLQKAYSNTTVDNKTVNADAKACRDSVKAIKAQERLDTKRNKLNERIAKLQKELSQAN